MASSIEGLALRSSQPRMQHQKFAFSLAPSFGSDQLTVRSLFGSQRSAAVGKIRLDRCADNTIRSGRYSPVQMALGQGKSAVLDKPVVAPMPGDVQQKEPEKPYHVVLFNDVRYQLSLAAFRTK